MEQKQSSRPKKVALYTGSWPQNIGNAFFDLGLESIVRSALPEANIFYTGGAVHWMFNYSHNRLQKSFFGFKKNTSNKNSFEIAQYADLDLVVVPGMCIADEFVNNNGKTFLELAQRKIPILFIGAGALKYSKDESDYYAGFLKKFYKYGIITRDSDTFEALSQSKVQNIEKGIDCAFFLPDRYTPPKLVLPKFNIENFDSDIVAPKIDHSGLLVLRTHHDCWGPLSEKYINQENTLVSDVPFDYLTLYANVNETYSDRVHACLATLAYGNKAKLFSTTPRSSLFKELGAEKITSEITQLDKKMLQEKKSRQIKLVRDMVSYLL